MKTPVFRGFPLLDKRDWWTRSQRIQTAAELHFEAVLFEATEPVYRRIARSARQLRTLGLSLSAIAAALDVSDKTVAKAIAKLDGTPPTRL